MAEANTLEMEVELKKLRAENSELRSKPVNSNQQADPYGPLRAELCKQLVGGFKPLAELPKNLQEPTFLMTMIGQGRIQLGQPAHHYISDGTKPVIEMGKGPVTWAKLDSETSKSLPELLEEDAAADPRIRLRIRLTNKAMA